jgi:hypothetical protein
MRIAAVAFVLIVGAGVVLAFANTLNSWVLGGLLGGLAAILLCIPISLAIFMAMTRRHEARQHATEQAQEEIARVNDFYEDELLVYEAEGYVLPLDEDQGSDMRTIPASARPPVSGYLALPPDPREADSYVDDELDMLARRDPRNYPRQPRYPARPLAPRDETKTQTPTSGATRRPATRSLALHQSAALRRARQEALQQQRQTQKGSASSSLARRSQDSRSFSTRRDQTSRPLRAPGDYRSEEEYETRQSSASANWPEDDAFSSPSSTEDLRERYQQYPRRASYPRQPRSRMAEPWTGELDGEDSWEEELRARRLPRDPERLSGNLRNPLVRRAPYLYEDDELSEELSRQLDHDHPITRRSSLYDPYRDEEQE